MHTADLIALSYRTIRSNKLRTVITVIIIALGIMALIAIITGVQAVNQSLTDSFSTMGSNSFSIRFKERTIQFGGGPRNTKMVNKNSLKEKNSSLGRVITYDEARLFKQRYSFPAKVGIALNGPNNIVVNNETKKTNPDVRVMGGDENYLALGGYQLAAGRNFSDADVESGDNVCIIGDAVAQKIYGDNSTKAIDQFINVANIRYRVIGVMQNRGSSAFFNADKIVITTYNNIRRVYGTGMQSYNIAVMVNDMKMMDVAVGEAEGTFRPIRKLEVNEENNFYIDKSDSIAQTVIASLGFLQYATIAIALITLIGAAIGLMNIMLVAVNERTKEIGLIKAIGGRSSQVKAQFLWESVLISLMGAVMGILAGILLGNIVAVLVKTSFVVPWAWVIAGVIVCTLVGLLAGLYPAYKASKLSPIEALRYE